MATPWISTVRILDNGEAVEAGITNRPTGDLTLRTQYLKDLIGNIQAGQALVVRDVAVDPVVIQGNPVYLAADGIFRQGLSAIGNALVGGTPSPTAFIEGIVVARNGPALGDVAVAGRLQGVTLAQWGSVFDGGVAVPGPVYLSAQTAGFLSGSAGTLAVFLGHLSPVGELFLNVATPTVGLHAHYQFNLSGAPAGAVTDPTVGAVHVVTTPNPALPGWLPATATYFPGWTVGAQIPTGAQFGYNLQQAAEAPLRSVFPPQPAAGAVLVQDGVELASVTVNEYGIWWMTNQYGQAPWPVDYGVVGATSLVELRFVKYAASSGLPAVTSLTGDPTSVVQISVLDSISGVAGTQGSLKLRIATLLQNGVTTDESTLAYKSFTGNTLVRGPVASRIKPGAGVTITGASGDGTTGYYGIMTLAMTSSEALQGQGQLATANLAATVTLNDFPVTELTQGVSTSPVWLIKISESAPATSTVTLLGLVTSTTTGVTPAGFDWRYKLVTSTAGGVTLPSPWSAASALSGTAVTAGQVKTITFGTIAGVPKGSQVLVQVRRLSSDSYAGNLGLTNLVFTLS